MNHWLLKSDPDTYSFDDLERDRRTVWDGVRNNQALIYLRRMKRGDSAFVYHSGRDKAVVGLAAIVRGAYPDPKLDDEKLVVVEVSFGRRLPDPVTLTQIKRDPLFRDFLLVRNSRLSVMPVPPALWKMLESMGGL